MDEVEKRERLRAEEERIQRKAERAAKRARKAAKAARKEVERVQYEWFDSLEVERKAKKRAAGEEDSDPEEELLDETTREFTSFFLSRYRSVSSPTSIF